MARVRRFLPGLLCKNIRFELDLSHSMWEKEEGGGRGKSGQLSRLVANLSRQEILLSRPNEI